MKLLNENPSIATELINLETYLSYMWLTLLGVGVVVGIYLLTQAWRVKGESADFNTLTRLIRRLEESEHFDNIEVIEATSQEGNS